MTNFTQSYKCLWIVPIWSILCFVPIKAMMEMFYLALAYEARAILPCPYYHFLSSSNIAFDVLFAVIDHVLGEVLHLADN